MPVVLAVNSGSSSLKAALFEEGPRHDFHYELSPGDEQAALYARLIEHCAGVDIDAIGHRVTHGGDVADAARVLDDEELQRLEGLVEWAPLHQRYNLLGIEMLSRAFAVPQVTCFDTAFHATLPALAQRLPVPESYGLRRYGFHGLAYASIARRLPALLGDAARNNVIVAHLGSGASLCLLENLQSVGTTMGLTPLGGIPMPRRSGDLDPAVVLQMLRCHDSETVQRHLYHDSGLLALSDSISADMRSLLASEAPAARFAVAYFCRAVSAAIGAFAAQAGGFDALVFSGGIGAHSAAVRAEICAPLAFLGIVLDPAANAGNETRIDERGAKAVLCLKVDEEAEIASATRAVLGYRARQRCGG